MFTMGKIIVLFLLSSAAFSQTFFLRSRDLRRIFNSFPNVFEAKSSDDRVERNFFNFGNFRNPDNTDKAIKLTPIKLKSQLIKPNIDLEKKSSFTSDHQNSNSDNNCKKHRNNYYDEYDKKFIEYNKNSDNNRKYVPDNNKDNNSDNKSDNKNYSKLIDNQSNNNNNDEESLSNIDNKSVVQDFENGLKLKKDYITGVLVTIPKITENKQFQEYFKQFRDGNVLLYDPSTSKILGTNQKFEDDVEDDDRYGEFHS